MFGDHGQLLSGNHGGDKP